MADQLPLPLVLAPHARFDTFVAGPNAEVVAALRTEHGERSDVVWIWGAPESGKSHLLQAACAARPEARVMYLSLALGDRLESRVLDGLETLDLVAIDDVDRVAPDTQWNRALFALINGMQDEGGRLLLGASQAPAKLSFALADVASRVAGSTIYQLAPLADADRVAALKLHAAARGFELSDAAGRYLLSRVRRSMGALLEWLDALDRASLAAQRKITIPLIRETLAARS